MPTILLNASHLLQLMKLSANKQDWETFNEQFKGWQAEVETISQMARKGELAVEVASTLKNMIDEVDELRFLIKQEMKKVSSEANDAQKSYHAIRQYLK